MLGWRDRYKIALRENATGEISLPDRKPSKNKVGKVTRKQVMDIVETKGKDLNSRNDEAGFKIIAGTARQMGLEIVD